MCVRVRKGYFSWYPRCDENDWEHKLSSWILYFDNFLLAFAMSWWTDLSSHLNHTRKLDREWRLKQLCLLGRKYVVHLVLNLTRIPRYPWHDKMIIVLSLLPQNFSTFELFFDVNRRVKGRKDKVNVKMLYLINSYSKYIWFEWFNTPSCLHYTPLRFVEEVVFDTYIHTLDMVVINDG